MDLGTREFQMVSPPADVNGSGIPDECEYLADVNGSGIVGITDFLALRASWGPCP